MHTSDLQDLREKLEEERTSLTEELASHGRAVRLDKDTSDWEGNTGGLVGEEADPTDAADKIEELVTNVPLVEELEARLKEVTAALNRMEQGSYGTCEVCGADIPMERLRANPAARTCVNH